MDKLKAFLIFDGAFVAVFLTVFFIYFLRRKGDSHFRENLWASDPVLSGEKKNLTKEEQLRKNAFEENIDKKILLDHKKDSVEMAASEKKSPNFKVPNFNGAAHEILGISQDASVEEVSAAYRHWIKRYHPDRVTHLGRQYVEQARRRAEQLNTARQFLLERIAEHK